MLELMNPVALEVGEARRREIATETMRAVRHVTEPARPPARLHAHACGTASWRSAIGSQPEDANEPKTAAALRLRLKPLNATSLR